MANADHLELLRQGVEAWNAWRAKEPSVKPDLIGVDLSGMNLHGVNFNWVDLSKANLSKANLGEAKLSMADLTGADLSEAKLFEADFSGADLFEADLSGANLSRAFLSEAYLSRANLREALLTGALLSMADLTGADLSGAALEYVNFGGADLSEAILREANLSRADLTDADLTGAKLSRANFQQASLVLTDLSKADLTGCRIYGMSAWDLNLEGAKQNNLIITREDQADITVDNIEVAQFVYLLLHNEKIRKVIDTITSKVVLILGRFTPERKEVLDALRDELRRRNYLPVVFDFEKPSNQTTDETITLLARMARFVIADLSDAKSILQELRGIVPDLPSVAVQPLILIPQEEPGMFDFIRKYPWVLEPYRYDSQEHLLANLDRSVVDPAEAKVLELRGGPG